MFPQAGHVPPPGYVLVYLDHQLQWMPSSHIVANGRPPENEEGETVNVTHGTDEERHSSFVSQSGVPMGGMHQVPMYPVMQPINNMFLTPHGGFPRYVHHPYSLYSNNTNEPITTSTATTTTAATQQNGVRRGGVGKSTNKPEKSSNDTQQQTYSDYETTNGDVVAPSSLSSSAAPMSYMPQHHPGMSIVPPPYSYPYYGPSASASMTAQHATGTPLYIPQVYQPAAIFGPSFLYHETPAAAAAAASLSMSTSVPSSALAESNKINSSNSEYTSLKISEYVEPAAGPPEVSKPVGDSSTLVVVHNQEIIDSNNQPHDDPKESMDIATNNDAAATTTTDMDKVTVAVSGVPPPTATSNDIATAVDIDENDDNKADKKFVSNTLASSSNNAAPEVKPTRILGPNDNASKFFPKHTKEQQQHSDSGDDVSNSIIRDPAIILEVKKGEIIMISSDNDNSIENASSTLNEDNVVVGEQHVMIDAEDDIRLNELSLSDKPPNGSTTNGDENIGGENDKSFGNGGNNDIDGGVGEKSNNYNDTNDSVKEIEQKVVHNDGSLSSLSVVSEEKDDTIKSTTEESSSGKETNEPTPAAEVEPEPAVKTWAGLFKNYSGKTTPIVKTSPILSNGTVIGHNVAASNSSSNMKPEKFHQNTSNNSNKNHGNKHSNKNSNNNNNNNNNNRSNSISHTAAPNENCFDMTQPVLPSFKQSKPLSSSSSSLSPNNKTSKSNNSPVVAASSSPPTSSSLDEMYLRRIGEFLRCYRLDHRAVNFDLHGLVNRGNRCYMNATIQALVACPPFFNLMRNLAQHIMRSNKGRCSPYALRTHMPIIDTVTQIVVEFTNLNKQRKHSIQKAESFQEITSATSLDLPAINRLLSAIQNSDTFVMGEQEDAQEFLTCLLNGLNDEMVELIQLTEGSTLAQIRSKDSSIKTSSEKLPVNQMSNGYIGTEMDDDSEWKEVQTKNKAAIIHRQNLRPTPLSEIFRGQLRSRLQKAGDQSTNNIEPFFTLHLNIEKVQSVREALELMVGRDVIEGVTSSKTNQEVDAWQQQTLEELPCVLLLHLKCFDYRNHSCSKIIKTIEFPIDLRIDTKIMSPAALRNRPMYRYRQYKLFAVVYHDGKEATKGHYITDVFHVGYAGWLRYDDAKVYAVDDKDVLKPKLPRMPYLLYYRRCDTIAALMQPPFVNKP